MVNFSNSPAFEQFYTLGLRAMQKLGHGFSPDGRTLGMTYMLERLLRNAGFQELQTASCALNFSAEAAAWKDIYRNHELAGQTVQLLLSKLGLATAEEAAQLHQQSLIEMLSPDFCGIWPLMSVWGTRP